MNGVFRYSTIFLLFAEISILIFFYLFGAQGISVVLALRMQNQMVQEEINMLYKKINALHETIVGWQQDPFYKEKVARELLQLAREDDHIYYISKGNT